MGTNAICDLQTGICDENQNFYSMCKPTLFPLRFIGGPPGLWRFRRKDTKPRNFRKVCSVVMLLALNFGAIADFLIAIKTSTTHPNYTFSQNMNLFFVLAISISGTLGLDILWWRRRELIKLLDSIDFEPKMCEITDAKCKRANEKEVRNKSIKMFIFMLFFAGYNNFIFATSSDKTKNDFFDVKSIEFHMNAVLYVLGFLAVYPFSVILSLYVSLSWIFRLKVKRMIRYIQFDIELAQNGKHPSLVHAKSIELWFLLYVAQFKKYDLVFKQIAGLIYVVMVWSVLSMSEKSITSLLNQEWVGSDGWDFLHESISISVLVYFLYSLSSVEYSLRRFVKLLYRLSLKIKFMDSTDESALDLSDKVSNHGTFHN